MDRRHFLRQLLAVPAVAYGATEVDWDQLLWTPRAMVTVPALWCPPRLMHPSVDELNAIALQIIDMPGVVDQFFKESALFAYFRESKPRWRVP